MWSELQLFRSWATAIKCERWDKWEFLGLGCARPRTINVGHAADRFRCDRVCGLSESAAGKFHGGLELAAIIDPAVTVKPPPVPLLVIQLAADPVKQSAGLEPDGVAQFVPKLTGASPALMNFLRLAVTVKSVNVVGSK